MLSKSLQLFFALALAASSIVACSHPHHQTCREDCYQVCDVHCDFFGCWEECHVECVCYEEQTIYAECVSSRECYRNETCIDGSCTEVVTATAGLCESCIGHNDCYESGAMCVTLSNGGTETVCGRSCTVDSDCPETFTCVELLDAAGRQCIPTSNTCTGMAVACAADTDCRSGEACESGSCVASSAPECRADAECAEGDACILGSCGEAECSADQDCDSGEVCDLGSRSCSAPSKCAADTDCDASQVCRNGTCVGVECQDNTQCDGGVCVDATCHRSCTDSRECASSEVCLNGYCSSNIECRYSSECMSGQVCVNANCEQSCTDTADCGYGYLCRLGFCDVDPGVECRTDLECSSGSCVDGSCAP